MQFLKITKLKEIWHFQIINANENWVESRYNCEVLQEVSKVYIMQCDLYVLVTREEKCLEVILITR